MSQLVNTALVNTVHELPHLSNHNHFNNYVVITRFNISGKIIVLVLITGLHTLRQGRTQDFLKGKGQTFSHV